MLLIDYLKSIKKDWPQLAFIVFDFAVIPAIGSEYKQVFSSCTKEISTKNSRLTKKILWY
jgi:hypothetical protein